MFSKITDKFQITIPKEIRKRMRLSRHDALEWKIECGKVTVVPVKKPFLSYQGFIRIGQGNIEDDIQKARKLRAAKFK